MDPQIRRKLRKIFAALYPDEPSIRRVTTDAGIDSSRIIFNSNSENNWDSVFQESSRLDRFDQLLSVAEEEYGSNKELKNVCIAYRQARSDADNTDASSRPFTTQEEHAQQSKHISNNRSTRQTSKKSITKQNAEIINSETIGQQHLQIENTLRSHPDFLAISSKRDFTPIEECKGRDFLIAKPKVAIKCRLPLTIDRGWCEIEFSDIFLRGLTIRLDHRDILKELIVGRDTPLRWQTRKFIRPLQDGSYRLSIGAITVVLSEVDAKDLCYCVDRMMKTYITILMNAENVLEAWNRPIESRYQEGGYYGYEILSLSIETWEKMFQFARTNAKSSGLGYKFYTSNSSISVETDKTTHAEISPKSYIAINGLSGENLSLLYIPPEYDETWQNKIGPKGVWTANFTKNWILEEFLPILKEYDAKDSLNRVANPNSFWNINDPRLFEYHLDVIHRWVCGCIKGDKPTSLFINYCQAFNQLVSQAVIEDRSNMWGYVLDHIDLLTHPSKSAIKSRLTNPHEEIQFILDGNSKHLQKVKYIRDSSLDFMFRGHFVLLSNFKINSTQAAINNFKKALWPLFEQASFEYRYCHLD